MPDTEANRLRRIDAVVKQAEIKFALGRQAEHVQALEAIRDLVETQRRSAAARGLVLLGGVPPQPHRRAARRSPSRTAVGPRDRRPGRPRGHPALRRVRASPTSTWPRATWRAPSPAGERALAIFEARGNVWWACRDAVDRQHSGQHVGEWARGLEYCRRALEYGQDVNDLRLKVVGLVAHGRDPHPAWRPRTGLACCEEALALSPIPFDAAQVRAARGYGLIKAGEPAAGIAELTEAVAWFESSRICATRGRSSRCGWPMATCASATTPEPARSPRRCSPLSREVGYRHIEGVAQRLLGESLSARRPGRRLRHLAVAAEFSRRSERATSWPRCWWLRPRLDGAVATSPRPPDSSSARSSSSRTWARSTARRRSAWRRRPSRPRGRPHQPVTKRWRRTSAARRGAVLRIDPHQHRSRLGHERAPTTTLCPRRVTSGMPWPGP